MIPLSAFILQLVSKLLPEGFLLLVNVISNIKIHSRLYRGLVHYILGLNLRSLLDPHNLKENFISDIYASILISTLKNDENFQYL